MTRSVIPSTEELSQSTKAIISLLRNTKAGQGIESALDDYSQLKGYSPMNYKTGEKNNQSGSSKRCK